MTISVNFTHKQRLVHNVVKKQLQQEIDVRAAIKKIMNSGDKAGYAMSKAHEIKMKRH
jgi:hypothetical protein